MSTPPAVADAVVVGAGVNGLVAANLLADAGWDVVVLEARPEPGGAVRTGALTQPGFRHDLFSAFYPLAFASPVMTRLALEDHGLVWRRAPVALAHPVPDGRTALLGPARDEVAASLEEWGPGEGERWWRLMEPWDRYGEQLVATLLGPLPPVRAGLALLRRTGRAGAVDLARLATLPLRRLAAEHGLGEGATLLLAGCALHSDVSLDGAGSGLVGWVLAGLAGSVGFPVPEGGAGALTDALVRRLEAAGGTVVVDAPVRAVEVRAGRAAGVVTAAGTRVGARRAVLADVPAPHLYRRLLAGVALPARLDTALSRFEWDPGTVKVDWALDAPIPWQARAARRAGTVHVADGTGELGQWSLALAEGRRPERPFLLVGQQSMTDPTRQPDGTETAWAYTRIPRSAGEGALLEVDGMVAAIEERMEERAPGFARSILGRHVFDPAGMEAEDPALDGGALNGGTAALHQQLVLRPVPGSGRPSTFLDGLYLASASAHPGGGVHGACGANAARAALAADRLVAWRRRLPPWRRGHA